MKIEDIKKKLKLLNESLLKKETKEEIYREVK